MFSVQLFYNLQVTSFLRIKSVWFISGNYHIMHIINIILMIIFYK